MSERQALLDAIRETPDDDDVRHVFADWLDDHGEADRATFIRLQCQAMQRPDWCAERRWMLWCAEQLLRRHPEWRAHLPPLEGVTWGRFERGFPAEAVVADFAALVQQASVIGEVGTVSSIVVVRADRQYPMARLPELPWLRALTLDGESLEVPYLFCEGVGRLAQAPLLRTLTQLRIDSHRLEDEGLQALAKSPHLPSLTTFSATCQSSGTEGWSAFLSSKAAMKLKRLFVRGPVYGLVGSPTHKEMVESFACAESLAELVSLDLSNRIIEAESYRLILRSPHLSRLRELNAESQSIKPEAIKEIANRNALPRLAALNLNGNGIDREGLISLLAVPCLRELERIGLASSGLTGPDGDSLTSAKWRTTIRSLDLSRNRLHASGLRRLFAADWPNLRELHLRETALKRPALDVLAKWSGLPRLRTLSLSGNDLGNDVEVRLRAAGLPADACLV